jgi:hypothetical protein
MKDGTRLERTLRRPRTRWSWAVGEYGQKVLVFEERTGCTAKFAGRASR